MNLPSPYALFLGDADPLSAKTATGIAHWRPERCVAQVQLPGCSVDLKLPTLTSSGAAAAGARLLIIGVANFGGKISESWIPTLVEALEAGLDLASGLHHRLTDVPVLKQAADRLGRQLYDVRHPRPQQTPIATGRAAPGQATADRRHRLRGGQDVREPRDRARAATTRRRGDIPGQRPDRHIHRGRRRERRCDRGELDMRMLDGGAALLTDRAACSFTSASSSKRFCEPLRSRIIDTSVAHARQLRKWRT